MGAVVGLAGPRKAQGRKGGDLISVRTDVLVADAELFLAFSPGRGERESSPLTRLPRRGGRPVRALTRMGGWGLAPSLLEGQVVLVHS